MLAKSMKASIPILTSRTKSIGTLQTLHLDTSEDCSGFRINLWDINLWDIHKYGGRVGVIITVMRDQNLKLEDLRVSHTLGRGGERG
jgi:hypothetical protein